MDHDADRLVGTRRDAVRYSGAVAGDLSAITNDRFSPSGESVPGPILNLFQLEMTAKQLYPEAFGEWPRYEEGSYPEIPEEERPFDRERVAEIINGDL